MNQYNQPFQSNNIPGYIPPARYKEPMKHSALMIGVILLMFAFIPDLINIVFRATRPLWLPLMDAYPDVTEQVIDIIFFIGRFVPTILIGRMLLKTPSKIAFPMRKPKLDVLFCSVAICMGASIFGGFRTSFVAEALISITKHAPTSPDFSVPAGVPANILFFISIAILPAILEELLFRGVIMQSLRKYGDSFALIISALLFGIAHGNFIQLPYTTLIGLLMGYFVMYTGSLWPGIIIHFVNNGSSVILDWIQLKTTQRQDDLIFYVLTIVEVLVGLLCLIILKIRAGSVFYIPKSNYPVEAKEKYATFFSSITVIIFLLYSVFSFVSYLEPIN